MISNWRRWLLKFYRRLARWFRPTEVRTGLLWAVSVGAIGGLSAIAFRKGIECVLWLWTRREGSFEAVAAQLPWWQRFLVPAGGGLTAGLVLHFGASLGHGGRSTDYMEAVAVQRGVMSVRLSLAKTVSSLFTIGSGGSIGREGAMVQLSAMLASLMGRLARLSTPRLRLMVACGAAGGLAAVYDVTLAAALFVAEIVLGSIATESLGPLLAAAAASSFISRYVGGETNYFVRPGFGMARAIEIFPYLLLGAVLGVCAPGYVWLLRRTEELLTRLAPPLYVRLTLGGVMVGALAIPFPEVWGNGRTMVNLVLTNPWPTGMLAAILICKVAATAATTGSGAVGGVFTPTLFTGAMLGGLFGHAVAVVWPAPPASPGAFALVGMAGFLSAATRAPLMSITMVFEMTMDYGLILPLLGASVVGYYTARSLQSDSIYSESLRRKQRPAGPADVAALRVHDLMKGPLGTVTENVPLEEIARYFTTAPYHHLLVVTLENQLRGVISLEDVEERLRRGNSEWLNAAALMQPEVPFVTPDQPLTRALEAFQGYRGERIPVVNSFDERKVLGCISKTDLLLSLAHGLQGRYDRSGSH